MYMGELMRNNPDLKNIGKTILLVLMGISFLIIQVSAFQNPTANFVTHGSENVRTSSNDFYNGTYPAQYGYFISIQNVDDDSDTVLGNITYAIDADNIIKYDQMQYANKKGTFIQWVFPQNFSLAENTFIYSSAETDYIYQRYIPITVHRWTNRSVFTSDGYQLASFSVSYDNLSLNDANSTFGWVFGGIATNEHSKFNASIVPGSFTTTMPIVNNPMASNDSHRFSFSNSTPIAINQVYNFSVVIHIHLKDPSVSVIEYYPGFSTSLMGGNSSSDPVSSFNATSPSFMLPNYARSANGSTNISNQWIYSYEFTRGVNLDEKLSVNSANTYQKIGVFRPSNHMFYLKNGTATTAINWGISTDLPVTGDWNGDGRTDVGIYRPAAHTFYLKNGTTTAINWGTSTDLPVTGDWNGDGITDVGVYRPSAHMFYLKNGTTTAINWGASTDLPVTGDWNGDGITDVGVYRPSAHMFYLKNGTTTAINWGASTDLPVTGDWNRDGITDVGVYRPSAHMFYLKNGTTTAINWGTSTDLPVTGKW